MKKVLFLLFFVAIAFTIAKGQVNFVFLPDLYGKNIDGLGKFQTQNLSGTVQKGSLEITVTENTTGTPVVSIKLKWVEIPQGVSNFQYNIFSTSTFNFSSNNLASLVSQTRTFPPGDYTYCFRFYPAEQPIGDLSENCFEASVQPLVPINLIYPDNGDTLCDKRPMLSWQPPIPFNNAMRFRLMLSEKKEGDVLENILVNTPLVLLNEVSTTTVNFPSSSPDLKEGKTYCWQVLAYQQGVVISTSEVWQFTVQCQEPLKRIVPDESYRELKLMVNGNYYVARGSMKFSYNNNYNIKKLEYSIIDIENGMQEIRHIPDVDITPGLNKISIDLTNLNLVNNKHYLLRVKPFNAAMIEVRFIYLD